jgi:predicted DNA-binding transcriptional regulator AlpA
MAESLARGLAQRYGDGGPLLEDKILIPDEVALLLRVKVDTLYRWRLDGDGPPFVRLGRGRGRIGYRKSDIDQYLLDNLRRSTSQEAAA